LSQDHESDQGFVKVLKVLGETPVSSYGSLSDGLRHDPSWVPQTFAPLASFVGFALKYRPWTPEPRISSPPALSPSFRPRDGFARGLIVAANDMSKRVV
jgi:hypothetical protein